LLLFLLHLISKMRPAVDGGSRFGIVLNGYRHVHNTGISTYVWIVSNHKQSNRADKVQLIDASSMWRKMRKNLGSKRKEMSEEHIATVTELFGSFVEAQLATVFDSEGKETGRKVVKTGDHPPAAPAGGKVKLAPLSRIFPNEAFGYRTITVERPLRDEKGKLVLGDRGKQRGKPQADSSLRDTENVLLSENVNDYLKREVLPHAPDAWIDHDKTKIGYEIPFTRHFYVFEPPRPLAEIDPDLKEVTDRILALIEGLSA
jgi:type I restriction enzyme M protein